MNKKIIWGIVVVIVVILTIVFLPIYKGRMICGINPEKGCWNSQVNLIDYLKGL